MSEKNDLKGKAGIFAAAAAKKARGLAVYAATKTKQLSRVAKLNVDIASQKDTIKSAYEQIGKLYYEAHREAPEGFFLQLCQEIDTANETIAALEAEIAQLKAEAAAKAQEVSQPVDADFESVVADSEPDIEVEIVTEEAKVFRDAAKPETVYPPDIEAKVEADESAKVCRDAAKPDVIYPQDVEAQVEAEAAQEAAQEDAKVLRDAAKPDVVYPQAVETPQEESAEEPTAEE